MTKKYIATLLTILLLGAFLLSGAIAQTQEKFIDVLLLIDGSGSMNWPDRDPDGLRIQGAKLFIDLCENNDRIGVIDFSTNAKIIFPLYKITTSRDKDELKDKIDTIKAKGKFTDITLALETALKEKSRARSDVAKAVILLTDGEIDPDPSRDAFAPHNKDYLQEIRDAAGNERKMAVIRKKYKNIVAPISREILRDKILPNYKEEKIPIFAVAFGEGADKDLLREIADLTITESGIRNYYLIEKAGYIQPVFSEIVEQLKKARERVIEKEIEFAGEEIVHKINIDDFIREVNFKFIFSRKITPEEVSISLRDPDGNIITRETKREGLGHIFEEGYELYNIFNPVPGTWEIIIGGKKDVKLDITISTWGRTELKILTEEMKPDYKVGEPIPILASLQIEGKRITSQDFLKNLKFTAWIENPENEVEKLDLYDDGAHSDKQGGDGIYGNLFEDTSIEGDYIVKIIAKGITTGMRKFNFTRETEYRVRVLPKEGVTPPVVFKITPSKISFSGLREGVTKYQEFTVKAQNLASPKTLNIIIEGINRELLDVTLNPSTIILTAEQSSATLTLEVKAKKNLSWWRSSKAKIVVQDPNRPVAEAAIILRGAFPWKALWIIASVVILCLILSLTIPFILQKVKESREKLPPSFELKPEDFPVRIGRKKRSERGENKIPLWDSSVSLCHAEITRGEHRYTINKKEGSLYVNDNSIDEKEIKDGDEIGIGDFFKFKVSIEENGLFKLNIIKKP